MKFVGLVRRMASWCAATAGWRRHLCAFALGVAATAAMPPVHCVPLLIIAFSGLYWLTEGHGWRTALATTWWFGLGHFTTGLYWFGHALMTDPERYAALVVPAVLGISALLAMFPVLAVLAARLCPSGVPRVVGFAAAWVLCEWLRSWVLTGFPWNLIAYGWAFSDAMIQIAALTGVWGLSLITVIAATVPATLAANRRGVRLWMPTAVGLALLVLTWAGGALRLANAENSVVEGIRLRLVQPNVAQHHKWDPRLREKLFALQLRLSVQEGDVSHIVWPETAIPYFISDDAQRRSVLASVIPEGGLLIGGALRSSETAGFRIWNTLHAIAPDGQIVGTYDKAHLVPFGEFLPLRKFFPKIAKITHGSIDFSSGPGPQTLSLPGLPPVSPLICYEAIFPAEVTDPETPPDWLLNITNDAWFGVSSGPYQHFTSARFRAVEQGVPLVRAANTGISAVVDSHGRVTARLGLSEQGILDASLPRPLQDRTFYASIGDYSVGLSFILGVFCLLWQSLPTTRLSRFKN